MRRATRGGHEEELEELQRRFNALSELPSPTPP